MTAQDAPGIPTVQKKTPLPPGLVPRHLQAWLLGGLAASMIVIMLFSGGSAPPSPGAKEKAPGPSAMDPSQARIQDYRARIEEQARKLAAEQAQLALAKQEMGNETLPPGRDLRVGPASQRSPSWRSESPVPATERSWLDQEREKREYQSRFASNIALSYRSAEGRAGSRDTREKAPGDTRLDATARRDRSAEREGRGEAEAGESTFEPVAHNQRERPDEEGATAGRRYRLWEGTILETVLTNRLDGSFSGPVNCMVTTNVYSHNRQHLLIPQGSRVLGEVKRVETFGQQRLAVLFHRLLLPNGDSVSLDQFRGLNQIGETGLRDQVNHHYGQVFGVSLAIGTIAGLSQANTRYGFEASATESYRQGVASALSQSSLRILDRYLNVLPTITIREGHRVKIYISDDLLLPAYEADRRPDDM